MLKLVIIGAGGFVGAIARFGLSGLVQRLAGGPYPVGTFAVNVLGCLLLGAAMGLIEERQLLSAEARLFLTIGLLGSFTTFSTLSAETYDLMRTSSVVPALVYVVASASVGLGALMLGRWAVRMLGA